MLLVKYLFDVVFIFEWLAFLFSLFNLRKKNPKPMWIFPLVLGFIVLGEGTAFYMQKISHYNGFVYNVLMMFWLPGYMAIFYGMVESKVLKRWILSFIVIFLIFGIANFCLADYVVWLASRIFILGGVFVTICSVFSLWEISNFPDQLILKNHPMFWISFSMLVYFFPVSILMGGFEYFKHQEAVIANAYGNTFRGAQVLLNIIHYSLLSYGFVCALIFPSKVRNLKFA
jgi:hypothetical protein